MFGKTAEALREYAKKFSMTPFEKKVYDALSNENWGTPNSTLMELASSSTNFNDYLIITRELWLALDEKPDKWRRIFKALVLLEFLVKFGNPRIIDEISQRQSRLRLFLDFRFFEDGRDRSTGIKDKAKYVLDLCSNQNFLDSEKSKASALQGRDRFVGLASSGEVRNFHNPPLSSLSSRHSTTSLREETVSTDRLDRLRSAQQKTPTVQPPSNPSKPQSKPMVDLLDDFDFSTAKQPQKSAPATAPVDLDFGDFQSAAAAVGPQPAAAAASAGSGVGGGWGVSREGGSPLSGGKKMGVASSTNPFDLL